MKHVLRACLCLTLLLLSMPDFALSQEGDDDAPAVAGPVPDFQRRERVKYVSDRVYLDMHYPEFGIPLVDDDIRERADRHQSMEDFDAMLPGLEPGDKYWHRMRYDVYAAKPGLLSVALFTSFMDQSMHNIHWRAQGATWDLAAERRVSLGDVFPRWEESREKLRAAFLRYFAEPDRQHCADALGSSMDDWLCPENDAILLYPPGYDWDWRLGLIFPLSDPGAWECAIFSLTSGDLAAAGADFRYWDDSLPSPEPGGE